MTENEKDYLKKFYSSLRDNIFREKNSVDKSKSILISLIETRSATRYKLLNSSTISSTLVPNEILMSLLSKKEIQLRGDLSTYAITARGVWDYECSIGVASEENFLGYINEKFFEDQSVSSMAKNELDDEGKVIFLAMIAARAFSEKSVVDLKKNDDVKSKWQEVLEHSFDLLNTLNLIKKLKKEEFFRQRGNDHVVSYIFRHNEYPVQKTRGIYTYKGNFEYYLDIYKGSDLSQENLSYLFWKIFKGVISSDNVDLIVDFCKDISSKESIFLFDAKSHLFSKPTFDSVIKASILDSVVSKAKWTKALYG